MKSFLQKCNVRSLCAVLAWLASGFASLAQGDPQLVGVWVGQGWVNTVELLLRPDGRYESASTTAGSLFGPSIDRGRYEVAGQSLRLTSYAYFPTPAADTYRFELKGESLTLSGGPDLAVFNLSMEYELKPGSRADVMARQQASQDLVRRWTRHILFEGDEEWTFRPAGCYCLMTTSENVKGLVEFQRGRYEQSGSKLTLHPYGGNVADCEVDIFGTTLTLISTNSSSGHFNGYEEVPGSAAEVAAKAADAHAFLSDPTWPTGVWQIQADDNKIDLLLRPDGYYTATNTTPRVSRTLWGRYTLAGAEIVLVPFVGQERYALDPANFGMEEQPFTVDYYDGELQLIDHKPGILQSVTLAYPAPGSRAPVVERVRQAQAERAREGWHLGIWETDNPAAWMEFTFRPDDRYIAKLGAGRAASEVERGQYVVAPEKVTLAPFAGNGPARGFGLDLYDGNLFLIGDSKRLVIVRKAANSETSVIAKSRDPAALKGERGSLLGLWKANWTEQYAELVFRADGQYRWKSCKRVLTDNLVYYDYGGYAVDLAARTVRLDSRFVDVQTRQLDFYGDTLTLYGGLADNTPETYTVNLGSVDAAIASSFAADAAEAQVDAQWLARAPLGLPGPVGTVPLDIGPDPDPERVFPEPTVFTGYQYYRQIIPRWFYDHGVEDTRQWHFFPNGRLLVRYTTWEIQGMDGHSETTQFWGAYTIGPKPVQTDMLHFYADNDVTVKLDVGDLVQLTLEDGRRNLFWKKECFPLASWALEKKETCQRPANPDATLINTGVSLSTSIAPDPAGPATPLSIEIARPVPGALIVSGTAQAACGLVLERTASLASPIAWTPLCTNNVLAGPFIFTISEAANAAAFFRLRRK